MYIVLQTLKIFEFYWTIIIKTHLPKYSHVFSVGVWLQWFIDPDLNVFVITFFSVGYEVIALDIVHTPSKNATKKKKKQKDSNPQVQSIFFLFIKIQYIDKLNSNTFYLSKDNWLLNFYQYLKNLIWNVLKRIAKWFSFKVCNLANFLTSCFYYWKKKYMYFKKLQSN